jgi:hypothetical protein
VTPRDLLTTIIELLGLAAIVFGVYGFDPRAGWIVGGAFIVYIAYSASAPPPAEEPKR